MNIIKFVSIIFLLIFTVMGCVSKRKLNDANTSISAHKDLLSRCESRNSDLEGQLLELNRKLETGNSNFLMKQSELDLANIKLKSLDDQKVLLKNSNNVMLNQLNSAAVINKIGAESIQKSLEAINAQSQYIKDLTLTLQYKDSVNLGLALNLKKTLAEFNDTDISIEVKKGVVYISLSDHMLFKSGSATINTNAEKVLSKIAGIINDQKELDVLVEGHTDNVPVTTECVFDNWDLSTKRATAVVRVLQNKYKVDPARMTAGGRSEYAPKVANTDMGGKASNRRTEIIILPKLDQFFKLMEAPGAPIK